MVLISLFSRERVICFLMGLFIAVGGFMIAGCNDDPEGGGVQTNREVNEVIYGTMNEWYLWYDKLPRREALDFTADPEEFFYSLLDEEYERYGCFSR